MYAKEGTGLCRGADLPARATFGCWGLELHAEGGFRRGPRAGSHPSFRRWMLESATVSADRLEQIDAEVADVVAAAMRFAVESPWPQRADTLTDVYADDTALTLASAEWRNA